MKKKTDKELEERVKWLNIYLKVLEKIDRKNRNNIVVRAYFDLVQPLLTVKKKGYMKIKDEVKLRLKLLKKVKCKVKDYPTTQKGWEKLHNEECKNCTWDGNSIFPNK